MRRAKSLHLDAIMDQSQILLGQALLRHLLLHKLTGADKVIHIALINPQPMVQISLQTVEQAGCPGLHNALFGHRLVLALTPASLADLPLMVESVVRTDELEIMEGHNHWNPPFFEQG